MAIGGVHRRVGQRQWTTTTVHTKSAIITPERAGKAGWIAGLGADKVAGLSLTRPRLITCGSSQERVVWGLAVDHQKIRLGVSGVAQGLDRWMRIGGIVWLGSVGI